MNNNFNSILLQNNTGNKWMKRIIKTSPKPSEYLLNSLWYHYSEPCHLDCGLDGKCDNSEKTIRCLCPFGKSGNKCEKGKQIHNFVYISNSDDWNHISIFPVWLCATYFFHHHTFIKMYFGMENLLSKHMTANVLLFCSVFFSGPSSFWERNRIIVNASLVW